jgi:hypothetical protein
MSLIHPMSEISYVTLAENKNMLKNPILLLSMSFMTLEGPLSKPSRRPKIATPKTLVAPVILHAGNLELRRCELGAARNLT